MLEGGGGGINGYTIYQQVHPDAQFSQAMSESSSTVKNTRQAHQDAAVELASIIESLDGSWKGTSAKAATGEFDALRKASEAVAKSNYEPADSGLDSQSGTHSGTRNTLEPMEPSAQEASWFGEVLGYESQEEYDAQWQRQNRHNIEVYDKYEATTQSNVKPLSTEFPEIPKATESDSGDKPGPGDKAGSKPGGTVGSGFTGGTAPPSSSGGTGRSAGGSGGSSGGGGTSQVGGGSGGGASTGDGVRTLPDGTKVYPDGTRVLPDGTKILPNGTVIMPDGTRHLPNGQIVPPGNTSASGLADAGRSSSSPFTGTGGTSAGFGLGSGGGSGAGGGVAAGFGPGAGATAGAPGALGAGKGSGVGGGFGSGAGAGNPAAAAKGAGGMGGRMGGGMMGGGGAGRGQGGGEETEHQDQYYVKQELDPGLHVEYDEFGEKLIDDQTGLTVVPPVIGE